MEKGITKEIKNQQAKISKRKKKEMAKANWVGGPHDPSNRPKPTTVMGKQGYVRHPKHKKRLEAE